MTRKSIKKIIATTLAVGLLSSLPISAFAKTYSNVIDGVTVTTTCNQKSSYHYIHKAYVSGSAKIYYTQNGESFSENIKGSSQADYWVASKALKANQYAVKATTTYNGKTVTAPYQ